MIWCLNGGMIRLRRLSQDDAYCDRVLAQGRALSTIFLNLFLPPPSPLNLTMSLTLKNFVQNSKVLSGLFAPAAQFYANAAGYRQIGTSIEEKKYTYTTPIDKQTQ